MLLQKFLLTHYRPNQFVAVCFAHTWNPPSMHTATILQKFRDNDDIPFVKIFILNAEKEMQKCIEIGYEEFTQTKLEYG